MTEESVYISNNIFLTSSPILYLSKIFGLAPLSYRIDGSRWKISLSVSARLYSFLLGVTLVSLTLFGIINEIKMGDRAFRMNNSTSKYVTCADVTMIEIVVIAAIINIPLNSKKLFAIINSILEVDAIINVTDVKHARVVSIQSLSIILVGTTLLLGFDFYVWHISSANSDSEFLITNYLAYHASYFVIILAECQFAHMGYCVKRRLKLMNDSLDSINYHRNEIKVTYPKLFRNNFFQKKSKRSFVFSNLGKIDISDYEDHDKISLAFPADNHVTKITEAYLTICDTTDTINDFFGHIVLIILLSCLLHLTVTPFFFIVELTGRCQISFIILQVLWFLAHFFQLILVVEPCNICLQETRNMSAIVCRLLASSPEVNENYKKQLEFLFSQLQYREIEFTAFGLGRIDRSLVTSMAGAVTVYLVTIIQFHNPGNSKSS